MAREQEASTWLDQFSKYMQQRFDESFRNAGVRPFYRTKLMAKKDMAREVRGRVERELFDDWRNGVRSAAEVAKVLGALQGAVAERLLAIDDTVLKLQAEAEQSREQIAANAKKWANTGLVAQLLGQRNQLFDTHAIYMQELYVRLTRIEAWTFAKALLAEIATELSDLKSVVDNIVATMHEALRRVSTGIDQRLKKADVADLKGHLIRFYDPEVVRTVTKRLATDEAEQRTQTAKVRAALLEALGPNPNFTAFQARLGLGEMIDRIEAVAESNASVAHDTMVTEAKDRILGVSIIAKLKERYGADPQELRAYITKLVTQAGCFVTVNPLEKNRSAPGIPSGVQTLVEKWIVILPKAPEHAGFVSQLRQAFKDAQPGDLEFIESDDGDNEIAMIAVKNLFPLRYLGVLPSLQSKYAARIAANARRYALELHTEGSLDSYPSLFAKTGDELRKEAGAYLIVAQAIGDLREAGGKLMLYSKDADGFDNPPVALGESLLQAVDAVDYKLLADLRRSVDKAVVGSEKDALYEERVRAALESIKPLVNGDVGDPRYQAMVEAARTALRIIKEK
jgi:hypothetical protein